MKRNGILSVLFCGALILSVTGCSDDDAVCGDGNAEGSEQCDLTDLKNRTCADVGNFTSGTLACSATCQFDTSGCAGCGNGIKEFGEQCDCGDGSGALPAGCTAANSDTDPNANCDTSCSKLAYCGDGVRDSPDEECDCGSDSTWQPATCDTPNDDTDPDSTCDTNCEAIVQCQEAGADGSCDVLFSDHCCDDDWGAEVLCHTAFTDATCSRACDGSLDCYWGNFCETQAGDPFCRPQYCGGSGGWPGELNDWCTISGTTDATGWCMPIWREEVDGTFYEIGACQEYDGGTNALAAGDECPFDTGGDVDRSEGACSLGACFGQSGNPTGHCAALCDWEDAYAVHILGIGNEDLPCPAGTNCFSTSEIDQSTGIRGADSSHCEADYINDLRTCDVISDELLRKDTNEDVCADLSTSTIMGCVVVYDGNLIGSCEDLGATVLNVWEDCGAGGTCPAGTECAPVDVFDAGNGTERCLPLCDTARHTTWPDCQALGAVEVSGATSLCTSLSQLYIPGGGQIDAGHGSPSRLGYCTLPPP